MDTKPFLIFYAFILFCLTGCDPARQVFSHSENNVLRFEYEYVVLDGDTVLDGFYRNYSDSGKLQEDLIYTYDHLNGVAKYYWSNGNLRTIETFGHNKLISQAYNWDFEGNIIDSNTIVGGNGYEKRYYKNGKILESRAIRDGVENGKYIIYDRSGNIIEFTTYLNGIKEGEAMKMEQDKIIKYSHSKDLANGYFYVYDSLDNLVSMGKLRNNALVDTTFTYYPNNKIRTRRIYKSANFTVMDSIRIGYIQAGGILGVIPSLINSTGILLSETSYNADGKMVKHIKAEDGNGF